MTERPSIRTALLVFAIATAVSAALYWIGHVVPWIYANLQALVAVVFLYLPTAVAWRRGKDLADLGFTVRPIRKNLVFGIGGPLVVFPIFFLGFYLFYSIVCASDAPRWLSALAPPSWCRTFTGWEHMHFPSLATWDFLEKAFVQVVVVALPEELFFRGFLLAELERAIPPRRRLWGGGIGKALVLSAVLFALGHVLVDLDPRRLAVFFPGLLFGWMRSATGSIVAGVVAHAASNLYIDVLRRTFFA